MPPTLLGRWQTRLWLMILIGGFFTAIYWALLGIAGVIPSNDPSLFVVLAIVLFLGLIWDIPYMAVLRFRWDHDWPAIFQLFSGIWEWLVVWGVVAFVTIPFVTRPETGSWWIFHTHYWLVWLTTFIASQGFLRILNPRWRFRGGQFGRY